MSRTFRRKGYENTQRTSWDRCGNRVAGFYTESDPEWWFGRYCVDIPEFRKPTRQEYYARFWRYHGDSHRNAWSPSRYYRHTRHIENKSINNQQLAKWIKNNDYEPLFESNPRSCRWDWM